MSTTLTDAEEITDTDIEALLTAAGAAGDQITVALCLLALDREFDSDLYPLDGNPEREGIASARRRGLEALGIIPEHLGADHAARGECQKMVAEARAARG